MYARGDVHVAKKGARRAQRTHFSRTFTPLYDSYGISTLLNSNAYDLVLENSPAGSSSRAAHNTRERA
jgi:hypothetical protein